MDRWIIPRSSGLEKGQASMVNDESDGAEDFGSGREERWGRKAKMDAFVPAISTHRFSPSHLLIHRTIGFPRKQ